MNCAAFSPDGRWVVTGSDDWTARLWDAETGQQIQMLQSHTMRVNSVAFGPDGRLVLTGSGHIAMTDLQDHTARLWDVETGREIAVLQGHTMPVRSAAFSPDGRRVVTGSWDNTARLWDVSRVEAIFRERAVVLTSALARGVGSLPAVESADLLMQEAPKDLFAEARNQLLDPQKYSAVEIARRERLLDQTIADLRAPLHPNCYLSPTAFAAKFGIEPPAKAEQSTTGPVTVDNPELHRGRVWQLLFWLFALMLLATLAGLVFIEKIGLATIVQQLGRLLP